jgi:glycine hydroxymethyltransferase
VNIERSAEAFIQSFRQTDLVLYAGTNLLCPTQAACDADAIGMIPVIGPWREKQLPDVEALADVEEAAAAMLCNIFGGKFAEARLQSCSQANLAVFIALLSAGDHVVCLHGNDGGHPSQNADGMLAHLAVKLHAAPFNSSRQCVDDTALAALIERVSPKVVMLGPSTILRPSAITRTADAAAGVGAALVVDVSHVAGLIAGGKFPNPLNSGADLITGSSYKTLGCPPAGFIIGRNHKFELKLNEVVSPKLVSNYDAGRLLRFTSALARSQRSFCPYARAIMTNTEALRSALLEEKVPVFVPDDGVFGTHQILVTALSRADAAQMVAKLQRSGVITSLCPLPGRCGSWAIRLGTQLVTRRGMGVEQMRGIANIIAAVIRPAANVSLREEVANLTSEFKTLVFCGEALQTEHARFCSNET